MKRILAYGMVLSGVLAAASGQEAASIKNGDRPKLDAFVSKGHGFSNPSYEELIAKLGKPKKESTKQRDESGGLSAPVTVRRIDFDGLTVVYEALAFAEVTIKSPAYKVLYGLGVGASAKKVTAELGEPSARAPGKLVYIDVNDAGEDKVEFTMKQGKVVSIKWDPYWD